MPSKLNNVCLSDQSCIDHRILKLSFKLHGLLRKEVIQPHLPIRLPCYDFTLITSPAFGRVLLAVRLRTSGITGSHGVTGGQGPGTYSPRHADPRLLAIPTSCRRVAACNLNWDSF